MQYKYDLNISFEFLASGRVIYGEKGSPNFPVKLANEIFHRCLEKLDKKKDLIVYDPCCGVGYMLTTICLLNLESINKIIGSDINQSFLSKAGLNFSLLTRQGLDNREKELQLLFEQHQKPSHKEALNDLEVFRSYLDSEDNKIESELFQRDILSEADDTYDNFKADIIMVDVPYGNLVNWSQNGGIDMLLQNSAIHMNGNSVVAVISDKLQKIKNDKFYRVEKFGVGKRKIEILKLK